MNFLRPEFLWALPLAGIPVLIHLLNRQRFVRVDFAAMEFLRRALRRTRRRLFLEDLLLLLLRTLAVLLLILALARPGVDPGSLLAGRPARGEVVVLDASMSMDHRSDGASAYQRALQAGLLRLGQLEGPRGDQAALVRAGVYAERIAFGDPGEVRAALEELASPDAGVADLRAGLAAARQTAIALAEEGCEQVRITLWSDFQATNWDLEDPGLLDTIRGIASDGRELELLDAGAALRLNLAVEAVEIEPAEISPGGSAQVSARIRSYDQRDRTLEVSLVADGAVAASAEIQLGAGAELTWSHPIGAAEAGARGLEVRIQSQGGAADDLAADDKRAAVLGVRAAPSLLLIGEAAPAGEAPGVFGMLRRFLDLGPGAPVSLTAASPSRAVRELAETEVAVLADPPRLDAGLRDALIEHVERGGGLLVAPGPETDPTALAPLFAALGLPGLEVGPPQAYDAPSARLHIAEAAHPALALFLDPRWQPLLTEVPHRRFRALRLPPEGTGAERPLRFVRGAGEDPSQELGDALIAWRWNGARCAVLSALPLPAWNGMASVPGGTLPLLLDLTAGLAPRPGHPRRIEVGQAMAVELPGSPTEVRLLDPDRGVRRPQQDATPLGGGRVLQPLLPSALLPGVWTVRSLMLDAAGAEVERVERIAVVPAASESDLAPLDLDLLRAQLPPGVLLGGRAAADDGAASAEGAEPRDLSGLLYLLMASFLAGETLLAAFLDRRRG